MTAKDIRATEGNRWRSSCENDEAAMSFGAADASRPGGQRAGGYIFPPFGASPDIGTTSGSTTGPSVGSPDRGTTILDAPPWFGLVLASNPPPLLGVLHPRRKCP